MFPKLVGAGSRDALVGKEQGLHRLSEPLSTPAGGGLWEVDPSPAGRRPINALVDVPAAIGYLEHERAALIGQLYASDRGGTSPSCSSTWRSTTSCGSG